MRPDEDEVTAMVLETGQAKTVQEQHGEVGSNGH